MDRCVLEVDGNATGVLVRNGQSYLFFAACSEAAGLEGTSFASIRSAEKSVRRALQCANERLAAPGSLRRAC
jgi:hypothetical protein